LIPRLRLRSEHRVNGPGVGSSSHPKHGAAFQWFHLAEDVTEYGGAYTAMETPEAYGVIRKGILLRFGQTGAGNHSRVYCHRMSLLGAGLWGLAGGGAAGLIALSSAVVTAGFHWPWHGNKDGIWPHLFVTAVGVLVGGVVAAAAHSQMTGPWPALLMGVGAPAVIRGALSRTEVAESKPGGSRNDDPE
jgi:hypothetical protein